MPTEKEDFESSMKDLEQALKFQSRAKKERFYFSGISKSFEVALEYAWKYLRKEVLKQGLDVYGPKDSIKMAGRLGLIEDVELWLRFINDRNLSVHDYIGIDDRDYLGTIKQFSREAGKLLDR